MTRVEEEDNEEVRVVTASAPPRFGHVLKQQTQSGRLRCFVNICQTRGGVGAVTTFTSILGSIGIHTQSTDEPIPSHRHVSAHGGKSTQQGITLQSKSWNKNADRRTDSECLFELHADVKAILS